MSLKDLNDDQRRVVTLAEEIADIGETYAHPDLDWSIKSTDFSELIAYITASVDFGLSETPEDKIVPIGRGRIQAIIAVDRASGNAAIEFRDWEDVPDYISDYPDQNGTDFFKDPDIDMPF